MGSIPLGVIWNAIVHLNNAIPPTALPATSVLRKNVEDILQNIVIQSYR